VAAAQVEEHQGGEPLGEHRLGRGPPAAAVVGGGDDARGRGDVEGVRSRAAAQVLHGQVELVVAVAVAVDGDHSGGFGVVPLRVRRGSGVPSIRVTTISEKSAGSVEKPRPSPQAAYSAPSSAQVLGHRSPSLAVTTVVAGCTVATAKASEAGGPARWPVAAGL